MTKWSPPPPCLLKAPEADTEEEEEVWRPRIGRSAAPSLAPSNLASLTLAALPLGSEYPALEEGRCYSDECLLNT